MLYNTNYDLNDFKFDIEDDIKTIKKHRVRNPVLSLNKKGLFSNSSYMTNRFLEGEYDLTESSRIIDTEAFVSVAFNKKTTLIFKNGFEITSKNQENLKYVKRRIQEIEYISKNKFENLLREYTYNLVAYHNPYLVKVRDKDASTGNIRLYKKSSYLSPVAAYYCLPPETILKKLNDAGEIISYRQSLGYGYYRDFSYKNIIYTPFNKRTGMTMATPPLEQVKDDILVLRNIEESIERLIDKAIFPLIHVTIGTEKRPATKLKNGISEVEAASSILENMHNDGGVVTSERTKIESIGAESLALRVESYLNHFKKRVYSGLGMSAIDFGEGDNTGKATGEVLSSSLKDSVITYQLVIEDMVTDLIFHELLLESKKYKNSIYVPYEEQVFFKFNDVDSTARIKLESHILNKMSSGIVTTNEARSELGYNDLSLKQMRQLHSVQLKLINSEIEFEFNEKNNSSDNNSNDETETKKTRSGNTKTKQSKKAGAENKSKSETNPKNQHTDNLKQYTYDLCNLLINDKNLLRATKTISDSLYNLFNKKCEINKINNIVANLIDCVNLNDYNKTEYVLEKITKDIDNIYKMIYKTNNN